MTAPIARVTGGSHSISWEVCYQLADKGYTVILGARKPTKGHTAVQSLVGNVISRNLSSELICVRNVFCVAVKGITFSKEALTPEKGFLKG